MIIICFRMAEICGLSHCIRAQLQETCSLWHPYSNFKVFLENLQLHLLEIPEPFHTTCATSFQAHPATAGLVPATDAGCGLSTQASGHWDGPVLNGRGVEGAVPLCDISVQHGERFHVNTIIHHVLGLLLSDIYVLYHCHLDLSAVHL